MMILGIQLPEVTTEILGSLIGVFLALGLHESIRLYTDKRRGISLRRNLLRELQLVREISDTGRVGYAFDCPIWTSAKNAGLLDLLDDQTVGDIAPVYMLIDWLAQDRRALDMARIAGNIEFRDQLLKHYSEAFGKLTVALDQVISSLAKKK